MSKVGGGGRLIAGPTENHKILPQFSTLVLYLHRPYRCKNTVIYRENIKKSSSQEPFGLEC